MSYFPEPALEPPEDVAVAICCVCGLDIYENEPYWEYEGKPLCLEHLDDHTAKVIGCRKKDGQE